MGKKTEQAVKLHRQWYPCSAAVLCAFADEAGMTDDEAYNTAMPFASGRAGKCGAVLAAETVLKVRSNEGKLLKEFEKCFLERNRSLICGELMGKCRKCVTDSSEILESLLEGQK